jgi:hypothetical protein
MKGRWFAGALLGAVGLAAPGTGLCSSCDVGGYEVLTLTVREVGVDGEPADDLGPWELPAELAASSWPRGQVTLTIGAQATGFGRVKQ